MSKTNINRMVWMLAIIALVSCGEKKPPSDLSQAENQPAASAAEVPPEDPSGLNVLYSVEVQTQTAGGSRVKMLGTKPMAPNIFKLTEPDRIVVDLTDTKVGNVSSEISVDDPSIQNIKVEQFDDSQSSLSRIEIVLKSPAEYQVESDGNGLALKIGAMDGGSSQPAQAEAAPVAPAGNEQVFAVDAQDVSQDPFALSPINKKRIARNECGSNSLQRQLVQLLEKLVLAQAFSAQLA
jgi:hypothetical protein